MLPRSLASHTNELQMNSLDKRHQRCSEGANSLFILSGLMVRNNGISPRDVYTDMFIHMCVGEGTPDKMLYRECIKTRLVWSDSLLGSC